MASSQFRRFRAFLVVVAVLVVTVSALATAASANPGQFSLSVSPAAVGAGTTTTFDATVTNESDGTLDSVTVSAPTGFTITDPEGGTFSELGLGQEGSTTLQVTAIAPCDADGTSGDWSATGSGTENEEPATFTLDTENSDLTTTLDGACSLAISDVGSGQKNTTLSTVSFASPGSPSPAPVSVEVLDAGGEATTTAADGSTVTLTLPSNPTALSGEGPADVSGGVATFSLLQVSQASLAYTVSAASSDEDITGDTSNPFQIWDKDIKCAANTQCSGSLDAGDLKTEPSTKFSSGDGIVLSYDVQAQLCDTDNYNHLPDVVTIDSESQDPTGDWIIKFTVSSAFDKLQPQNGVSFYQLCLATTIPFKTLNNTDAQSTVIGGTTYYYGLVQNKPKCSEPAPCLTSRTKTPAGQPVLVLRLDAGDPWTH